MKRESHAPFWATLLLLVLNQAFNRDKWGWREVGKFLEVNGRTFVELVGILAGCGLLIGAFSMTGVISSLAGDLLRIAGGNVLLLLAMTALTSLVLGLGLTTTACYIFLAILVGPALEQARAEPHGRAHVRLLLGHAVGDHAAGGDRVVRRCGHRRFAGDEDRLGVDARRLDHLLPAVLLRAQPGARAAGAVDRGLDAGDQGSRSARCSSAAASRATRCSSATCAVPVHWNGRCACC